MRIGVWAVAVGLLLAACDDDGGAGPAAQDGAAAPDAGAADLGPAPDLAVLDAAVDAAAPDMAPVQCADGPDPECDAFERQVGCGCESVFDRRCETDLDCRPNETCRVVEGSALPVCWFEAPPPVTCPGSPGCEDAAGPLLAGAARRAITPMGFEVPNPAALDGVQMTFAEPFDPEAEWYDCGFDGLCAGDAGYPGPDEGEGDGRMQGVWIAGFGYGRPALHCPPELIGCEGPECCAHKWAHDDLQANALVLRKGQTTVALVSLDLLGFFHDDIDAIRARLAAELEVDLVLVGSTHNHEGPDTVGQWGPGNGAPFRTGREPYVFEAIIANAADAVREAVDRLEPARVAAGVVETGVDGMAITDSRTPYIFDDNLPILHVTAADTGATIATAFSYGNHAEVRWSGNQHLTADYFGAARRHIEAGLDAVTTAEGVEKPALQGLGGVTVSFAGAVGGLINPGRGGGKDYADRTDFGGDHTWAAMDAVGQRVAMHVLQAVHGGGLRDLGEDPPLRFAHVPFLTRVNNPTFELGAFVLKLIERNVYNVIRRMGGYEPDRPLILSEVNVVRLGALTLFTAPGEAFPETLCGGYPGKGTAGNPVVGDVQGHRAPLACGPDGLPVEGGALPCLVKPDQENAPDWSAAPDGPYVYDRVPGEIPFFIGLGGDFVGYMVPTYDYQPGPAPLTEAPGDHYEETNSVGGDINPDWERRLDEAIELSEGL